MARITVDAVPSNTNVTVQDGNNISANIQTGASVNVQVTPQAKQIISINRGLAGPPGPNTIGGYPINIVDAQPKDVLMFGTNEWVNTPQTEIADGGNF